MAPPVPEQGRLRVRADMTMARGDARARTSDSGVASWIAVLIVIRFAFMVFSVLIAGHHVIARGSEAVIAADATRFHQIAEAHGIPYRDFQVEYPPMGLGVIEAVGHPSIGTIALILGILGFVL